MVLICIGALAFLGVTWLDIKNSDVTDTNTGYNSQLDLMLGINNGSRSSSILMQDTLYKL